MYMYLYVYTYIRICIYTSTDTCIHTYISTTRRWRLGRRLGRWGRRVGCRMESACSRRSTGPCVWHKYCLGRYQGRGGRGGWRMWRCGWRRSSWRLLQRGELRQRSSPCDDSRRTRQWWRYAYTSIYVYMYLHTIRTYVYRCICIYTYIRTYVYVYIHLPIRAESARRASGKGRPSPSSLHPPGHPLIQC